LPLLWVGNWRQPLIHSTVYSYTARLKRFPLFRFGLRADGERNLMSTASIDWVGERLVELERIVRQLLDSNALAFDDQLHGLLPEQQGIYMVYAKNAEPGEVLRAGKTRTAAGGLRQRIYRNHFMGDQAGNLRAQLVQQGVCKSMDETKSWIRSNCIVRYTVIEDDETRKWAEYLMASQVLW